MFTVPSSGHPPSVVSLCRHLCYLVPARPPPPGDLTTGIRLPCGLPEEALGIATVNDCQGTKQTGTMDPKRLQFVYKETTILQGRGAVRAVDFFNGRRYLASKAQSKRSVLSYNNMPPETLRGRSTSNQ